MRAILCLAALGLVAADTPAQPRLKSGAELVHVDVTVTDASGRVVTGLSREAFEVSEDGRRQEIVAFSDRPVPTSVLVLLDVSGSMRGPRYEAALARSTRWAKRWIPTIAGRSSRSITRLRSSWAGASRLHRSARHFDGAIPEAARGSSRQSRTPCAAWNPVRPASARLSRSLTATTSRRRREVQRQQMSPRFPGLIVFETTRAAR